MGNWKPNLDDTLEVRKKGKNLLKKALTEIKIRLDCKWQRDLMDAHGRYGYVMDKCVLTAKDYIYGTTVSCHRRALETAIEANLPLVMYIDEANSFYTFDGQMCLDVGEPNDRGRSEMINFPIRLGENCET